LKDNKYVLHNETYFYVAIGKNYEKNSKKIQFQTRLCGLEKVAQFLQFCDTISHLDFESSKN